MKIKTLLSPSGRQNTRQQWVYATTNLSDTTIWRLEQAGKVPKAIQLSQGVWAGSSLRLCRSF